MRKLKAGDSSIDKGGEGASLGILDFFVPLLTRDVSIWNVIVE